MADEQPWLITGGSGFLGWHLRANARALHSRDMGNLDLRDPEAAGRSLGFLDAAPVIFHLAGVNRAATEREVEESNLRLAETLARLIRERGRPVHVVYANSTQSTLDNAYGQGKAGAAEVLRRAASDVGGTVADVILPNLFGEHGRPHYNSFVATFCHLLTHGQQPKVTGDREINLLHAQGAAKALTHAAAHRGSTVHTPRGENRTISSVRDMLSELSTLYARGEVPDLTESFSVDLFNTFRSYAFPHQYPMRPNMHEDARGRLFETVRSHGGTGQAFMSTTVPGRTRGEHYHLHKFERFIVVAGEAEIALRRLFSDEIVRFKVSGDDPGIVDMPTMWVHNITNVGDTELVTMFWSDQLLDHDNLDQYPENVQELHA